MAIALDGSRVPDLFKMACGGTAYFDADTGYAYRCERCMAVIGSVGQSDSCKEINEAARSEESENDANYK